MSPGINQIKNCSLTAREVQCIEGLARGLSNNDIAKQLEISLATVALHLGNARRKLGAKTREQAVALAVKRGLIDFAD
jgi:DNA-binding CsgD family transcriptional regulator